MVGQVGRHAGSVLDGISQPLRGIDRRDVVLEEKLSDLGRIDEPAA
jgi:hypothetical protein